MNILLLCHLLFYTEKITEVAVMMTVLLFLLCVVVEVHSQTYPFVRFGNTGPALSNHSYVDLTAVGDRDDGNDSVQCHTDLDTCFSFCTHYNVLRLVCASYYKAT